MSLARINSGVEAEVLEVGRKDSSVRDTWSHNNIIIL